MRYITSKYLDTRLTHYVTHGQLTAALAPIDARLAAIEKQVTTIGAALVSTQSDVDALQAQVETLDTQVQGFTTTTTTAITNITAEITALQQANPGVDTTALAAAVTQFSTDLSSLGVEVGDVGNIAPASGN